MPYLPRATAALTTPDLAMTLQSELTTELLPLEQYLEKGGWPQDAKVSLRACRVASDYAELPITVEFTERCPAACPSSARDETRVVYMKVRLRLSDGWATIDRDDD